MPRRPAKKSKRISRKRKKGFSWRLFVKSSKQRQRIIRFSIVALLLFVSLTFLGGISFYKSLTKSFVSAESTTSNDINNSDVVTFSIVFVEDVQSRPLKVDSIYFIFLDKLKKKVVSYEIPVDSKTEVPGKFGEEEFGKILSLGMLSNNEVSEGAQLLNKALSRKFGFRADRYLLANQLLKGPLIAQFIQGEGSSMISYDNLTQLAVESETNISLSEFYNILSFTRALSPDRFINITNIESSDLVTREITFDSTVSLEKASVAVLNGSGISGVAAFGERVVSNVGGHVITSENASQLYEESILVTDSYDSEVVKEIINFFGIDRVILKGKGGVGESIVDRVDVTLIIGLDVAASL